MPYTVEDYVEDYVRDYTKEHLHTLTLDERLVGVSPKELLQHFSVDEVLQCLPTEAIEAYLANLSPTEILQHLSTEAMEAYLAKLKGHSH